jgi:hypothetical protein
LKYFEQAFLPMIGAHFNIKALLKEAVCIFPVNIYSNLIMIWPAINCAKQSWHTQARESSPVKGYPPDRSRTLPIRM